MANNHDQSPEAPGEDIFFEPLIRTVQTGFGAAYSPEGRRRLKAAAENRRAQLGLSTWAEYDARLRRDPEEWALLWPLALASGGAFLRPAAQFEVVADLLAEWSIMAPERTLRTLSLGCGSGSEPVSLAITLEEAGLRAKNWQVEIYGLDLNPAAVTQARKAVFTAADLEWLPDKKWFTPRAGGFHFKGALAPAIHLFTGNAYDPETWPFESTGFFDLIFCRGLTFEAPPQAPRQLIRILCQALAPTGFIFTAPGEFLPDHSGCLHLEERNGVTYYRRGQHRLKANRRHQTKKQKAGREFLQPAAPEPLPPLTPRERQILESADRELRENRPDTARALVMEAMLSALDRRRPAPEAWARIARIEESLGRPDMAAAAAELAPCEDGEDAVRK